MHTSTTWVDFKALRQKLSFREILEHFQIEVPTGRNQYKGRCPLPNHRESDTRPTFSADLDRGIFKCFGCSKQGNLLEFAALMQGVNPEDGRAFRRVALELQERLNGTAPESRPQERSAPERPRTPSAPRVVAVNAPLDFELKGLEPGHPAVSGLGISEKTARHFGIGYAERGSLKGRIAVPLHVSEGRLVGYASRGAPETGGAWSFPESRERNGVRHEFRYGAFLYNAWRHKEPQEVLVVAQHLEDVWALYQGGMGCAVATMVPEVTPEQAALLTRLVRGSGRVVVPARHDRQPEAATLMAGKLSVARFVRVVSVHEGQPLADAVRAVLE